MEKPLEYNVQPNQRVRVVGRDDLGIGEVLRVAESGGVYQADVAFESRDGRRLETFPANRLQAQADVWDRLAQNDLDLPLDFLLKQLAYH
jgi:hypothetical protein